MIYNIKYTNIQYGGNSVVDIIKLCNNVYNCDQEEKEVDHFKCIRKFLLKIKNIKIVLGAGNIDNNSYNSDYDRLKDMFDLAITNDADKIDKTKSDLIGYNLDFNSSYLIRIFSKKYFENSISLIVFDQSTIKFLKEPERFLRQLKSSNVLTSNGTMYIPSLGAAGGGLTPKRYPDNSSISDYIIDEDDSNRGYNGTYIPNDDELIRQTERRDIPLIRGRLSIHVGGRDIRYNRLKKYKPNMDFYIRHNSVALREYFGNEYTCELFMDDDNYPIITPDETIRNYHVITKL